MRLKEKERKWEINGDDSRNTDGQCSCVCLRMCVCTVCGYCVYLTEEGKDRGSGVPPAAVCRLGVHGGWAEWKAQPTHREHLARHQLCTRHAGLPASTAQTHKPWRSKQRQTNTLLTHLNMRGGRGSGTYSEDAVKLLCMRLTHHCAPVFF